MLRELKGDCLEVKIYSDRSAIGKAAAGMVSKKIVELLQEQESINMIFAAAPSQNEFLASLISSNVDWSRINAFHMDEYIGLPEDHPALFSSFLREHLFYHLPFRTINYIHGNYPDVQAECNRYADLLQQYPTDMVCMGIGENGHIAFNDPHIADFNDMQTVKIVDLDMECRQQQVNDNCFPSLDDVPTYAITLTVPALMAAKYAFCVVPGKNKARAVHGTLYHKVGEQYPASILRNHRNAILFLDSESSSLLNY